jgi:medium-chain acyl-[acyl-carrier-protein] hydrolase
VNPDPWGRARDGNAFVLILRKAASESGRIRLICFPYAGGSPYLFQSWLGLLAGHIELAVIQLPGHAARIKEAPYHRWDTLVSDCRAALGPLLAEPHAFYGHSFGGRLAYEIARHETGRTRGLFVSACRSPGCPQQRPYMHELGDSQFAATVRAMGGTPAEVFCNAELMRLFLPVLRAEIRLAELWAGTGPPPLTMPVTALYGQDDSVETHASMRNWPACSRAGGELIKVPGGHFFVETHRHEVVRIINDRLGLADVGLNSGQSRP